MHTLDSTQAVWSLQATAVVTRSRPSWVLPCHFPGQQLLFFFFASIHPLVSICHIQGLLGQGSLALEVLRAQREEGKALWEVGMRALQD